MKLSFDQFYRNYVVLSQVSLEMLARALLKLEQNQKLLKDGPCPTSTYTHNFAEELPVEHTVKLNIFRLVAQKTFDERPHQTEFIFAIKA